MNFENLISRHSKNSKEFMKILSAILKKGDNKFCVTSFLITLDQHRTNITDAELDLASRSYNWVQYLSPHSFSNVNYGFNYVIQHRNVIPR